MQLSKDISEEMSDDEYSLVSHAFGFTIRKIWNNKNSKELALHLSSERFTFILNAGIMYDKATKYSILSFMIVERLLIEILNDFNYEELESAVANTPEMLNVLRNQLLNINSVEWLYFKDFYDIWESIYLFKSFIYFLQHYTKTEIPKSIDSKLTLEFSPETFTDYESYIYLSGSDGEYLFERGSIIEDSTSSEINELYNNGFNVISLLYCQSSENDRETLEKIMDCKKEIAKYCEGEGERSK